MSNRDRLAFEIVAEPASIVLGDIGGREGKGRWRSLVTGGVNPMSDKAASVPGAVLTRPESILTVTESIPTTSDIGITGLFTLSIDAQ